jgi:hypothetical protein
MKKVIVILSFLIIQLVAFSQTININELRKEYAKVNADSLSCFKLYKKVSQIKDQDNTINGYKGAISAMKASFVKDKKEKLKLFNEGKEMLERSIVTDSSNIELRFLRFTIQTNAPKVLGYNKKIESDKNYIITHFDSVNKSALKNMMQDFLIQSAYLSENEKSKIKK